MPPQQPTLPRAPYPSPSSQIDAANRRFNPFGINLPPDEPERHRRLFDQFIEDPNALPGTTAAWTPSGLNVMLTWEGEEPTEAEIDQVFTQVFDEGWLTKDDFAVIGGLGGGIAGGLAGGFPGAVGGATAGGAAGQGLAIALRPRQVGRMTVEGVPRSTYMMLPGMPPGGFSEAEEPAEGAWYPGRTLTGGDIAKEVAVKGAEEGLLEAAGGALMRPLQWLGRGIQRITMGGEELPSLMAETGQRVIKESLEQGVGPRSTYAGSRWMPWNRAMGGRPAGMAGQKIEEAADAIDNLVAQVGAFETPLQGTTTFLHDVLRSPGATRGLSLADELQLTNDYALKEALSNAEIVSGGLGPVFSRYMTVPGAKASTLKPTDVLGAKTLLPRDPGLTAGGEISLRQAINDKRYLEKRVIAPLYKQLRGGGPVQATSTLQIAKAIRDQLSDRIKQSLQLVETTNPQFKGLVAEYEKHNQNIQMLNYIDRLIVQSDPRILPQMALGFGAGTGAGILAGADPGTSLLAGGAAATMLSPPLLSRTARSLYGLGKLPVAQTAVRGADVLSTRGTTPSGQQQSLQVPGQGQAVQTPFPGDPTSMASIMRRQLPEPTDPTVPPIYRYLTGNLP